MNVPIIDIAEQEIHRCVKMYDEWRPGHGDRVLIETGKVVANIGQFPETYQLITRRLRRVNLTVVPFQLYYAIADYAAPVLGVLPSRMNPPTKHRVLAHRLRAWETSSENVQSSI